MIKGFLNEWKTGFSEICAGSNKNNYSEYPSFMYLQLLFPFRACPALGHARTKSGLIRYPAFSKTKGINE